MLARSATVKSPSALQAAGTWTYISRCTSPWKRSGGASKRASSQPAATTAGATTTEATPAAAAQSLAADGKPSVGKYQVTRADGTVMVDDVRAVYARAAAWLMGIDRWDNARWEALEEQIGPARPATTPAGQPDQVQHLLQQLPEKYRLALILRYWYDLSYAEIARVAQLPENTVKTRLHRARQMMAGLIKDREMTHGVVSGTV